MKHAAAKVGGNQGRRLGSGAAVGFLQMSPGPPGITPMKHAPQRSAGNQGRMAGRRLAVGFLQLSSEASGCHWRLRAPCHRSAIDNVCQACRDVTPREASECHCPLGPVSRRLGPQGPKAHRTLSPLYPGGARFQACLPGLVCFAFQRSIPPRRRRSWVSRSTASDHRTNASFPQSESPPVQSMEQLMIVSPRHSAVANQSHGTCAPVSFFTVGHGFIAVSGYISWFMHRRAARRRRYTSTSLPTGVAMPIYEYSCPDCGNQFSHLHKRLGETAPACPKCQGANARKRISTFSARVAAPASACAAAGSCPAAAASGHQCCAGCRHH